MKLFVNCWKTKGVVAYVNQQPSLDKRKVQRLSGKPEYVPSGAEARTTQNG